MTTRTYFVFHGVTHLAKESDWDAGYVNSTVTGYGETFSEALTDARKREAAKYGGRYRGFDAPVHFSGPHRRSESGAP